MTAYVRPSYYVGEEHAQPIMKLLAARLKALNDNAQVSVHCIDRVRKNEADKDFYGPAGKPALVYCLTEDGLEEILPREAWQPPEESDTGIDCRIFVDWTEDEQGHRGPAVIIDLLNEYDQLVAYWLQHGGDMQHKRELARYDLATFDQADLKSELAAIGLAL